MTVVIYKSTDTSAPALSGSVGSLVALLDACLVTGYGSKAAAGWSKPYTGTNSAAFRQGSSGFYVSVDDNGPGAGTAKEARFRGYETMSAVATGTGPFPTVAQAANGQFIRKSATADATARAWIVAADNRTFYLLVQTSDIANVYFSAGFGDFYSYKSGDAYKCFLSGRFIENNATGTADAMGLISNVLNSVAGQLFIARASTQTGTSVLGEKFGDAYLQWTGSGVGISYAGPIPYTNPADGGLYIAPLRVKEGGSSTFTTLRGELRGLFHQGHPIASFTDGDTFNGTGLLAGRSFLLHKFAVAGSGTNSGVWCIETTDWPTST